MIRSLALSLFLIAAGCADASAPGSPAPASLAPATATAPVAAPATASASATVRDVDVTTLKADLDRSAVPLLIDVRSPAEYATGHVPGAKNVPIDEIDGRLAELGTADAEVYVICQSGGRSARASASLAGKGRHPVNVTGGTAAWKAAGYPVE